MATAKLRYLPTELLLTVAGFIQPDVPYKLRIHHHHSEKDFHESLRLDFTSLVNLSSVCRRFRELLTPRIYQSIAIFGEEATKNLMALLRLLQAKPEICGHIKHLYLDLYVDPLDISGVTVSDLRSLNDWSKNPSIRIPEETLERLAYHKSSDFTKFYCKRGKVYYVDDSGDPDKDKFAFSYDPSTSDPEVYDDTCLAFVTSVLLYALPDLKELALSGDRLILQHLHFPFDFGLDPVPRNEPNEALDHTSPLPKLEALAVRFGLPTFNFPNRDLVGNEFLAMRFLGRCAKELCIHGFPVLSPLSEGQLPDNITSLILKEVWVNREALYRMLKQAPALEKFMYLEHRLARGIHTPDAAPAGPRGILASLKFGTQGHSGLKTLCLDLSEKNLRYSSRYHYDTFKNFPALENLYINAWCLEKWKPDEDEDSSDEDEDSDGDEEDEDNEQDEIDVNYHEQDVTEDEEDADDEVEEVEEDEEDADEEDADEEDANEEDANEEDEESSDEEDSDEEDSHVPGQISTPSGLVWKPHRVFSSLPRSLKRLHIAGSAEEMEHFEIDVGWLAIHAPNLEEIAFDMPSSGRYLYGMFASFGKKALTRADNAPIMW